ncbi:hypothetical protein PM082_019518 [Marasmius tenuissimus]|nr:hypothetical protein PM082_019518 [Marasmius tenuissimus]
MENMIRWIWDWLGTERTGISATKQSHPFSGFQNPLPVDRTHLRQIWRPQPQNYYVKMITEPSADQTSYRSAIRHLARVFAYSCVPNGYIVLLFRSAAFNPPLNYILTAENVDLNASTLPRLGKLSGYAGRCWLCLAPWP